MVAWRSTLVAALVVLVVSGAMPAQASGSALGSWTRAPDLPHAHIGHTATLLADGRVLIAGGIDQRGVATANAELFDPISNRWSAAASMHAARYGHGATLLADGDVLVAGGQQSGNGSANADLASAEVYDPRANRWKTVAPMHAARPTPTAVRLHDGRVLIVGGIAHPPDATAPAPSPEQAEIYDPAPNAWSFAGAGLRPLNERAVTLMPDGSVLVSGGSTEFDFATTDAELFDPQANTWQPTSASLADSRLGHTATLLRDGRVLLVGGYTTPQEQSLGQVYPSNALLMTSEIFDVDVGTDVRAASSTISRFDHTATLLSNGMVLVVGSAYDRHGQAQLFDPHNGGRWIATPMAMDRYLHTATLLRDGRVLIVGGYGTESANTAWIFSLSPADQPSPWIGAIELIVTGTVSIALLFAGLTIVRRRKLIPRRRLTGDDESEWLDP